MQEVCYQYWPEVQTDVSWKGHVVNTLSEDRNSDCFAKRLITITDPQVNSYYSLSPTSLTPV